MRDNGALDQPGWLVEAVGSHHILDILQRQSPPYLQTRSVQDAREREESRLALRSGLSKCKGGDVLKWERLCVEQISREKLGVYFDVLSVRCLLDMHMERLSQELVRCKFGTPWHIGGI